MTKNQVMDVILETKVIAVIRLSDAEKILQVVRAVREGGIRAVEITMTVPRALDVIRDLSINKKEGDLIGAGTVLDGLTAEAAIRAGAGFVVSPVFNPDVLRVCRESNMAVIPGAFTATEILAAWKAGADIVKIFPASAAGPAYFKDILGPFPKIRLMPTGGVTLENALDFIRAGACCVGIGSALLDKSAIEKGEWGVLTKKSRTLIDSLA